MNVWDLLLSALLLAAVALALRHSLRLHRAGKFSCGGDCGSCPLSCRRPKAS
ncbi:MAG: FeoB-associated Cys-rich membrane protein [Erysipelotrichaceae bacterium]|nr:FeoB-associated Cys-rich membrane protein [Erysipelotrichaceae bacterium]